MVGRNSIIIETASKTVLVLGFTSDLGKPLRVPVLNAVVAYDCEFTGETYILVIYNALHMKSIESNLIPPFMLHLAGLEFNECPKLLSKKPGLEHHLVLFPKNDIILQFKTKGIISYLPTQPPDKSEMSYINHLVLTPASPIWDPPTFIYRYQENSMMNYRG